MSYITTYGKTHFNPINPKQEDINIEDIAHALSLLCRANGHFKSFYSVGQHSINCMMEAKARGYSEKVQLACLLHDASEAYLSDITRPVKKALPQYIEIEEKLQKLIWDKWLSEPLNSDEFEKVFKVDDALFYYEFMFFMQEQVLNYTPKLVSRPTFKFLSFTEIENQFLRVFKSFFESNATSFTVGVDWCKGKWLAVKLENGVLDYQKFNTINELCAENSNADSILVDIPIGLPESQEEANMRPDRLIAKRLGSKSSSVFNVPFRQITRADTLAEAWDLSRSLNAKMQPPGMAIRTSIRQVDVFLQQNMQWKNKLVESHPEYAFLVLNDLHPLKYSKLTPEGQKERIAILTQYCEGVEQLIEKYKTDVPYRKKIDDLIDALCLAVVGKLGIENGFITIPENPNLDSTGLKMQIVTSKITK